MTRRSVAAVALAATAVLLAGGAVFVSLTDEDAASDRTEEIDAPGTLEPRWRYEAETGTSGNHHELATATVDGETVVAVPVNGLDDTEQCRLEAVDADGNRSWRADVPAEDCSIHAVGDAAAGDVDGDGAPEFAVGTGEHVVRVLDADTGEERARGEMDSFGFSAPLLVDGNGSGTALVAADFTGGVHGFDADGDRRFSRPLEGSVWASPIAVGTGPNARVAVAHGKLTRFGEVVVLTRDGEVVRRIELPGAPISWAQVDEESVVAATRRGDVVAVDLGTGDRRWAVRFDTGAAVGAATDGRAFVSAPDGRVYALGLDDGGTAWSAEIVGDHEHDGAHDDDHEHAAPAPTTADVDGDGALEVVAVARDGTVSVLDAETGDLLARHAVDGEVFVHPAAADVDGEAGQEVLVLQGDGRVVALSYAEA